MFPCSSFEPLVNCVSSFLNFFFFYQLCRTGLRQYLLHSEFFFIYLYPLDAHVFALWIQLLLCRKNSPMTRSQCNLGNTSVDSKAITLVVVNNPALLEVCGVHIDEGDSSLVAGSQWLDLPEISVSSPGSHFKPLKKNQSGFSLGKVRAPLLQRNKAMVQYFNISVLSGWAYFCTAPWRWHDNLNVILF